MFNRSGRFLLMSVVLILIWAQAVVRGQSTANATLAMELMPKSIHDQSPAQLVVTINSSAKLTGASITITPPPGFKADPSPLTLPEFTGKLTESFVIKAVDKDTLPGQHYVLKAEGYVPGIGGSHTTLADQTLTFDYTTSEISLLAYVILGLGGIVIGYALRLLLKVLSTVTPPPAAPAPGVGPITDFVQRHYYLVDLLVTLALGFFALVALTQGNHPPQTGTFWYSALATGVSLGLLTNTDLLVKLRR